MKHIFIIITLCIISFADSKNMFFIVKEPMSLECKDVNKLFQVNKHMVDITFNESGRIKFHTITKNNVNGKLGLIADGELIFINIRIAEAIGEKEILKDGEKATLFRGSFSAKKGNINKFINTFKHCKELVQ